MSEKRAQGSLGSHHRHHHDGPTQWPKPVPPRQRLCDGQTRKVSARGSVEAQRSAREQLESNGVLSRQRV